MGADYSLADFGKLQFLSTLRGGDFTHAEYRVLVTLLSYTDRDGCNAHPGVARLADDCHMSTGTVRKALRELKRRGWVYETHKGRPAKHRRVASTYRVQLPPNLRPERS